MGSRHTAYIMLAAFLLDCLFGDPQNPYHPIRFIGKGIAGGTAIYRKGNIKNPAGQFAAGAFLALLIIGLAYGITWLTTWAAYRAHFWMGMAVESLICYFLIAARALRDESMLVYRALEGGDLEGARKKLSFIVGRDTQSLSEAGVIKGAVETVAENLSDGAIAPLIFMLIGGAPLAMAYKAANTLDSMLGYRNAEMEYYGKFAARLDDVLNYIPSRFSAWLMILVSALIGMDAKGAWRIYRRDRDKHLSPNSAQTESVCAGAIGLSLGGTSEYQGIPVHKPSIGDPLQEPAPAHIIAANRLVFRTVLLAVALLAAAYAVAR